jgi:hypothetical protein
MSEYPSGNALRDEALLRVIRAAQEAGEPITAPSISVNAKQMFGPSFVEVSATELAEALEYLGPSEASAEAEGEAEAAAFAKHRHQHQTPLAAPDAEPVPEVSASTRDQLTDRIAELGKKIAQTRADIMSLGSSQRQARGVLAKKIQEFAAGSVQPSREDCVREVGETMRAVREGRLPVPPRPNRANGSYIDRVSGLDGGPGASDRFARKQMARGYHRMGAGDVYGRIADGPNGQAQYGIRRKLPSEL